MCVRNVCARAQVVDGFFPDKKKREKSRVALSTSPVSPASVKKKKEKKRGSCSFWQWAARFVGKSARRPTPVVGELIHPAKKSGKKLKKRERKGKKQKMRRPRDPSPSQLIGGEWGGT